MLGKLSISAETEFLGKIFLHRGLILMTLRSPVASIHVLQRCYEEPPKKVKKQAGAELGQAQYKLGLDFTLIFCRFGLVELVRYI